MNMKTENWLNNDIRFIEIENEWWAVAKDVAGALDYSDTHAMTRHLKSKYLIAARLTGTKKANRQIDRTLLGDDFKYQSKATLISEFGIYKAVLNSQKPEAEEFEEWIFTTLKALRKSVDLEGYQVFRMTDKEIQKELTALFEPKEKKDYMVINKMANAIVSKKFGYEKALRKADMPQEMLIERQKVLQALIGIANMTGSKGKANKIVKQLLG